jgi:hypothetical protein
MIGLRMSQNSNFMVGLGFVVMLTVAAPVVADSKNLAPGFSHLPKNSVVVVMQPDVELFSISVGGVTEPKAAWTEAAVNHSIKSIDGNMAKIGLTVRHLSESDSDDLAEVNSLHAAIARSIALHHMTGGKLALPTKNGKLDWSLGEAVAPLRDKAGSDYALFTWVRDTYSSGERKATMFALALLGFRLQGGIQQGYASLVDLRTGQVLWFNQLARGIGDLREEGPANESISALLKNFPRSQ